MNRVWIYQANKFLSETEAQTVNDQLGTFIENWKAHGTLLKAQFRLIHNLFIVIQVDEKIHAASGCSIDDSVRFIQNMQIKLNVDFFNRQRVAYEINNEVKQCSLKEFKQLISDNIVNGDTIIYNNAISNSLEFTNNWRVPMHESWLNRFVPA